MKNIIILVTLFLMSCTHQDMLKKEIKTVSPDSIIFTDGFDFPVGKPDAKDYYNAQGFKENYHLGDDWNGTGGGNTDLGDPIYAIANGYVSFAEDMGGAWGKIIRIVHYISDTEKVESFYAHCNEMYFPEGRWVNKGAKIGTIGNCNGVYSAHLHFEMRNIVGLPIGGGYSSDTTGYINPTKFIENHRH